MKEYYSERFSWIFRYTSKNVLYCLAKTLCLVIGLPIYCVMVAVDMVLTFVNMIFCWIPILGMVIGVICKAIIYVIDKTFFICILTDIGKWRQTHKQEVEYDVSDVDNVKQDDITNTSIEADTSADSQIAVDVQGAVDAATSTEPNSDNKPAQNE